MLFKANTQKAIEVLFTFNMYFREWYSTTFWLEFKKMSIDQLENMYESMVKRIIYLFTKCLKRDVSVLTRQKCKVGVESFWKIDAHMV